ncbi:MULTISPECIES: hypothetical protein [Metabacillus]|uniref:hypothetical protein n=1 Tax=Metabacillus TaxID=2675233 RepID=UPI001F41BC89|nr:MULTISPECIES: hypothetical protein [Metabacillus]MDX8290025.1 hypothetical protein [Metabacillus indicus]
MEDWIVPVSVVFNMINVVSMAANSIISSGQNSQPDWNAQGKFNSGNGNFINSGAIGCTNIINDQDLADMAIAQPENINPQPVSQI